jgi:hypothetical protein
MTRILIRAGRPPHDATSNESALGWRGSGHFGSNTGNMLFSDSVYRMLSTPSAELTCDAYAPEWRFFTDREAEYVNEHFDAYVLPLANAFRRGFGGRPLARLTQLIDKLTIPVVIVGVGGQSRIGAHGPDSLPEFERDNTVAFVKSVLKRSASIGVRGEYTKQLLLDLGFSDSEIDVIGCPSMFVNGPDFRVRPNDATLRPDSPLAINLETAFDGIGDLYQANETQYSDLVVVYQTLAGCEYIMWGEPAAEFGAGTPKDVTDRAYREGRLRFFTNSRTWHRFMAEREFAFGTRIHGVAAAIAAGTPAFLLAHDSRTLELAEYHGVPHAPYKKVIKSGRYRASDLYERANPDSINAVMAENFHRYAAFLERNGLEHVYQPGKANPEYETMLAEVAMPEGVAPIPALSPEGLTSRLRWLWQGRSADHNRPTGHFQPDFALDSTRVNSAGYLGRTALSKLDALTATVEAQAREIGELKALLRDGSDSARSTRARDLATRVIPRKQ